MNKFVILSLTMAFTACTAFAQGEAAIPAAINSRIFSTQNASPFGSLERTQYTNRSINRLETKNKTTVQQQIQDKHEISDTEKDEKGGLLKGIRVIW